MNHQKFKKYHYELIEDTNIECLVSISSLHEIAIKKAIKKIEFNYDFETVLVENQFTLLNINYSHLNQNIKLPLLHNDPFDRMIISQSIAENIPLISYDKVFEKYDYLKP